MISEKVVLLGDLHFGKKSDDVALLDYQEQFFAEVFFPYLLEHGIKKVYQFGDLFEKRRSINFYTLKRCTDFFFERLEKHQIEMVSILGNHDVYYNNTNQLNSSTQLLAIFKNIRIVEKPTTVVVDGATVDLVPWVSLDDYENVHQFVSSSSSDYCFGHFDVVGALWMKNQVSKKGWDATVFDHYRTVFSGHYHTASKIGNVFYLGTPYQLNFADVDDEKGFYTFSFSTGDLEFIKNPLRLFEKTVVRCADDVRELNLSGKYVKLVIDSKIDKKEMSEVYRRISTTNALKVDLEEIQSQNPVVPEVGDSVETDLHKTTYDLIVEYLTNNHSEIADSLIAIATDIYENANLLTDALDD